MTSPPSSTSSAGTDLVVTVKEGPDGPEHRWRLTCSPPGGNHPAAEAACRALATAKDPFAPVPKDQMCTQIYGGPQTARITGSYEGRPVDASYKRTDGCEISRWQALEAVLVVPGGAPGS